jgi:hypothetical protein
MIVCPKYLIIVIFEVMEYNNSVKNSIINNPKQIASTTNLAFIARI